MCGGACVCWFSRTHKCVTLSTSEAEYVALGDAVKELLFLRQVWRFVIPGKGMPCCPIFEDSQGALHLSKNPVSNSIRNTSMFVILLERACPPGGHHRRSCSF